MDFYLIKFTFVQEGNTETTTEICTTLQEARDQIEGLSKQLQGSGTIYQLSGLQCQVVN